MPDSVEIITRAGAVICDARKAAFIPRSRALLVADLHFEKGSFLQMVGHAPLPTYDTKETLSRLSGLIEKYQPEHVIALGDSYHDTDAGNRLPRTLKTTINELVESVPKFTWILGNHDPDIPSYIQGGQQDHLGIDGFLLTHLPAQVEAGKVNICGHLHPKIKVPTRRRPLTHPCFACGEDRIILPSLGAYTGGLYVEHPDIQRELKGQIGYILATQKNAHLIVG